METESLLPYLKNQPLYPVPNWMNQSTLSHLISFKSILILSFHLRVGLRWYLPFRFSDQNFVNISHLRHSRFLSAKRKLNKLTCCLTRPCLNSIPFALNIFLSLRMRPFNACADLKSSYQRLHSFLLLFSLQAYNYHATIRRLSLPTFFSLPIRTSSKLFKYAINLKFLTSCNIYVLFDLGVYTRFFIF
jgi:hypothetical protein